MNLIRQFLKEGRKLPMYMETLPSDPASKEIFQLQSLFGITIRVEAYKKTGPAQYFNCQGFGHSSVHCGHSARCVKCGGQYLIKSYSKTPDQAPKCCNCGEEHIANYRKCPVYAAEAEKIQKNPESILPEASEQYQNTEPNRRVYKYDNGCH